MFPFTPAQVGGHFIGVALYYLTHKAKTLGYHPRGIPAGRRINDNMGHFLAESFIEKLAPSGCLVDVKCALVPAFMQTRGVPFWRF